MVGVRAIPVCLSLILAVLVAACARGPATPAYPPFSFTDLPPIELDVAAVEIDTQYVAPLKEPNVEHRFPVTPAQAAESWARDRLRAVGASGVARFTILEASVVEEPLPTTPGVRGAFTRDQAERYSAVLHVRLDVENAGGLGSGFVEATARRTRSVAENVTLNERDRVFYEMTEALIADLNRQLESAIRSNLGSFLRS